MKLRERVYTLEKLLRHVNEQLRVADGAPWQSRVQGDVGAALFPFRHAMLDLQAVSGQSFERESGDYLPAHYRICAAVHDRSSENERQEKQDAKNQS